MRLGAPSCGGGEPAQRRRRLRGALGCGRRLQWRRGLSSGSWAARAPRLGSPQVQLQVRAPRLPATVNHVRAQPTNPRPALGLKKRRARRSPRGRNQLRDFGAKLLAPPPCRRAARPRAYERARGGLQGGAKGARYALRAAPGSESLRAAWGPPCSLRAGSSRSRLQPGVPLALATGALWAWRCAVTFRTRGRASGPS